MPVNNNTLDVQNEMTEWKFKGPHELLGENAVRDMSKGWEPLEKLNYFDLFSGWGCHLIALELLNTLVCFSILYVGCTDRESRM